MVWVGIVRRYVVGFESDGGFVLLFLPLILFFHVTVSCRFLLHGTPAFFSYVVWMDAVFFVGQRSMRRDEQEPRTHRGLEKKAEKEKGEKKKV